MRPWSKRELLAYLDRVLPALEGLDYFELLDVGPKADGAAIQAAFHSMAAGLHPDRHRNTLDTVQHERLIIVYARIAEAYRILRDPVNREEYLRRTAREQSRAAPAEAEKRQDPESALALLSPKAQHLYRRAMAARRTGDLSSAVLNLRMALARHPHSGFLKEAMRAMKKHK